MLNHCPPCVFIPSGQAAFLSRLPSQSAHLLWAHAQQSALWLSHFLSLLPLVGILALCSEQDSGLVFSGSLRLTLTTRLRSGTWLSVSYFLWPVGLWIEKFYSFLCPLTTPSTPHGSLVLFRGPQLVSWSQTFWVTPRIYAQADMQRLGNAFIVTVPKSHRNSETELQLCYYIVCYLGNADSEWQAQSAFHSKYVWTPTRSKVLDRYLATR